MDQSTTAPSLFEGTASYYSRYRSGYPTEAFDTLVRRFTLNGSTHVLDLGCGTGQIAIPIAKQEIPVHAVDPDTEMLSEGLRAEQTAEVRGIAWTRGDDKSLGQLRLPPLSLCAMGASFHWMDRDQVLKILDTMIVPKGGVAVLSGGASVWSGPGSGWPELAKQVVIEFLGPERRAGSGVYNHPPERHEVVLKRSPFAHVNQLSFVTSQVLSVEHIVGLQLSTSYASPAQLGDRIDEFKRVLSDRLFRVEPSGIFRGTFTTELLIATR